MEKIKIKVSAGYSGVIASGRYENSRPSYIAEVEYDIQDLLPEQISDHIKKVQNQLQEVCYKNFKADEQRQIVERIQKERADMRFYNGYPSVTSIISWDSDYFMPPQELQQYASQGSLTHAQVEHYIKTGVWEDVNKIDGTWADIVIVQKGNLGLAIGGWDFLAFLTKYPIEKMENGKAVKSDVHKYGGTPDIRICYYEGKKTLADVKRTPDKIKNFKQLAAYIMAEEEMGESPYEQMMIIPLNNKTQQGYSKPILCEGKEKIQQYKDMFLRDREAFSRRYGI